MTQHDSRPADNTALSRNVEPTAATHPHNSAVFKGNHALLETLGLLPAPVAHQDTHLPADSDADNTAWSLSQALIGSDKLQAYLVTDYLASLTTEDTQQVANLLATDTWTMLQQLAHNHTPDSTAAAD